METESLMAKKATKKSDQTLTTAQRLGSLVKSARDIMRKDKGLNGDLDRLPMLTWVMFLKFLDDQERIEEERAKLKRQKFRPVIESPYRWRDWASKEDGISGDALRAFPMAARNRDHTRALTIEKAGNLRRAGKAGADNSNPDSLSVT